MELQDAKEQMCNSFWKLANLAFEKFWKYL